MLPPSLVDFDNAPDIVLAILAGERVTRCWEPECNHWSRHSGTTGKWFCACHAKELYPHGKNTFLCDGTRVWT